MDVDNHALSLDVPALNSTDGIWQRCIRAYDGLQPW
jgi:hypothetical protein